MKKHVDRYPNMNVDTTGHMTCTTMNHFFDYPPHRKTPRGEKLRPRGPCEGEELGAAFDPEKLAPELYEAIKEYARAALRKGNLLSLIYK